jgi:hypothetical protein
MAGRFRQFLQGPESFSVAICLKLSIVMKLPEAKRPAALKEISTAMCGPSEIFYNQLLNFDTCRYKNIWSSPFKDLYEMTNSRHCVGAVCPADTVAYSGQLADFFSNLAIFESKVHRIDNFSEDTCAAVFNPEGTLATVFKEAAGNADVKHYIIINGDYGPVTTELFNTVADDNKMLKFEAGEPVPMPQNVKIVFVGLENGWDNSTPAFVSRLGMVNMC